MVIVCGFVCQVEYTDDRIESTTYIQKGYEETQEGRRGLSWLPGLRNSCELFDFCGKLGNESAAALASGVHPYVLYTSAAESTSPRPLCPACLWVTECDP